MSFVRKATFYLDALDVVGRGSWIPLPLMFSVLGSVNLVSCSRTYCNGSGGHWRRTQTTDSIRTNASRRRRGDAT